MGSRGGSTENFATSICERRQHMSINHCSFRKLMICFVDCLRTPITLNTITKCELYQIPNQIPNFYFYVFQCRLSISVPMAAMYGYDVESFDDPCIRAIDEGFLLAIKLLAPTGTWINVIPVLAYVPPWFPGAVASRAAARIRELNKDILGIPWEFAKKSFVGIRVWLNPDQVTHDSIGGGNRNQVFCTRFP